MPAAQTTHRPRVVHSTTLKERFEHRLSMLCATMGCAAIEARAMWAAGNNTIVEQVEVGAAEGDVMRLKRMKRPPGAR